MIVTSDHPLMHWTRSYFFFSSRLSVEAGFLEYASTMLPSSRSPFSRATFSLSSSLSRSDIGTNIGQRQSVFTSDPKAWWNDRENGSRTRRKKLPIPAILCFLPHFTGCVPRVWQRSVSCWKKNDWWDQWADDCWRLRTSLIWDDAAYWELSCLR